MAMAMAMAMENLAAPTRPVNASPSRLESDRRCATLAAHKSRNGSRQTSIDNIGSDSKHSTTAS